jgi:hypothetical protein
MIRTLDATMSVISRATSSGFNNLRSSLFWVRCTGYWI